MSVLVGPQHSLINSLLFPAENSTKLKDSSLLLSGAKVLPGTKLTDANFRRADQSNYLHTMDEMILVLSAAQMQRETIEGWCGQG